MEKKEKLSLNELFEQALVKDGDKPYIIPENWVWTRIGNITTVVGGGTPSTSVDEYYTNGDIAWITPADLSGFNNMYISNGKRNITRLGLEKSSARLMPKDTVILSSRAPIGYVAIAENELCTNQGFKSFLPSPIYESKFLYFYLIQSKELLESLASGTTFLELSSKKASQILIPLAPLPEQQRIVDLIESLFDKLDRAKELLQNALDSFEKRKSAILFKAFTGELTCEWREENRVDFDRHWVKKVLRDCGEWCGGGTPSKSNPSFWENGDLLWVSPKDMKSMYIEDTEDKISKYAVDNSSAKLINNQAILFVVRSGILRRILPIAITMGPVTVNQDIKALMPKDIDIKYLYWYCLYKESDIRNSCAKNGTTVESISSDLLYKYIVLLPPIEEQRVIARSLDTLLENEQKANKLCDVIDNIDLMKKSILARAFRGELSTNNPNEESALELLKGVLRERVGL